MAIALSEQRAAGKKGGKKRTLHPAMHAHKFKKGQNSHGTGHAPPKARPMMAGMVAKAFGRGK